MTEEPTEIYVKWIDTKYMVKFLIEGEKMYHEHFLRVGSITSSYSLYELKIWARANKNNKYARSRDYSWAHTNECMVGAIKNIFLENAQNVRCIRIMHNEVCIYEQINNKMDDIILINFLEGDVYFINEWIPYTEIKIDICYKDDNYPETIEEHARLSYIPLFLVSQLAKMTYEFYYYSKYKDQDKYIIYKGGMAKFHTTKPKSMTINKKDLNNYNFILHENEMLLSNVLRIFAK